MRRKVFGILFSVLLFAPVTSTFIWLQHKKNLIKHHVKEQVIESADKSELTFFRFSDWELKNKLKWEHSREFEYNGMMYDIVEKSKEGDMTLIWCWPDKKESEINKVIRSVAGNILGNDKENKQRQTTLTNFLKTLFSPEKEQWHCELPEPKTIEFKPIFNTNSFLWAASFGRPPAC